VTREEEKKYKTSCGTRKGFNPIHNSTETDAGKTGRGGTNSWECGNERERVGASGCENQENLVSGGSIRY